MAALTKLLNTKEADAGGSFVASVNISAVIYDEVNDHLRMIIFHRCYELPVQ